MSGVLRFLRHEDGKDVHLNLLTGKEVFTGRPTIQGDTEEALFTQLRKIEHAAINFNTKIEPLTRMRDAVRATPSFERFQKELLPEAERIASGPGRNMSYAHYTHGRVLMILQRLPEAESAFRQANELHPGVFAIILALVSSLMAQAKHEEALPFAREATDLQPLDTSAQGNLAICLINCGHRDEARKAIDFAILLDPEDPINRYVRDNFERFIKK